MHIHTEEKDIVNAIPHYEYSDLFQGLEMDGL